MSANHELDDSQRCRGRVDSGNPRVGDRHAPSQQRPTLPSRRRSAHAVTGDRAALVGHGSLDGVRGDPRAGDERASRVPSLRLRCGVRLPPAERCASMALQAVSQGLFPDLGHTVCLPQAGAPDVPLRHGEPWAADHYQGYYNQPAILPFRRIESLAWRRPVYARG